MKADRFRWFGRNYKWLLPTISIVVTIGIGWFSYFKDATRPARLRVRQDFAVDLLSPVNGIPGLPLQIFWTEEIGIRERATPLKNLHIVRITFENTGDKPFDWAERVREPIALSVIGQGRILRPVIIKSDVSGPAIKTSRANEGPTVTVEARFLNPHEQFALLVYHDSDTTSELQLSGRIYDHPSLVLERAGPARTTPHPLRVLLYFLVVGIAFGAVVSAITEFVFYWRRRTDSRRRQRQETTSVSAEHVPPG